MHLLSFDQPPVATLGLGFPRSSQYQKTPQVPEGGLQALRSPSSSKANMLSPVPSLSVLLSQISLLKGKERAQGTLRCVEPQVCWLGVTGWMLRTLLGQVGLVVGCSRLLLVESLRARPPECRRPQQVHSLGLFLKGLAFWAQECGLLW